MTPRNPSNAVLEFFARAEACGGELKVYESKGKLISLRQRLYAARRREQEFYAKVLPKDDPAFGTSPWDQYSLELRRDAEGYFLLIAKGVATAGFRLVNPKSGEELPKDISPEGRTGQLVSELNQHEKPLKLEDLL